MPAESCCPWALPAAAFKPSRLSCFVIKVVGLELLKQQIRQFHHSVVLDKKREDAGHKVKTGGKYHMIFQASNKHSFTCRQTPCIALRSHGALVTRIMMSMPREMLRVTVLTAVCAYSWLRMASECAAVFGALLYGCLRHDNKHAAG